ncbi:MAG: hypothetical protein SWO11_15550 [Thermodesulfobacteriota bacterium]|nr:hypothetical protein [Thermodesulfobacteriota bacterium]
MKRIALYLIIPLGVPLLLLINGCMSPDRLSTDEPGLSYEKTKKIGVMPFLKGKHYTDIDDPTDKTLTCRLDQLCFDSDILEGKADEILTRLLSNKLKESFAVRLILLDEITDTYKEMDIDIEVETPRSLALKLGKQLGATHMILGVVWRYTDRVGTAVAVNRPASVAFAVYLLDVETKEKLWKGVFDRTQQPLSENILDAPDFFRHGAKWLSASELARFGVGKVVKSLPLK